MKNYFYIDANNSQQGPVPAERLKDYGVTQSTMVQAEGMANWTEAGQVEDLTPLFAPPAAPFTPQPQPQPQPQYGQQQPQPQSQPQGMVKPDSNLIWALTKKHSMKTLTQTACLEADQVKLQIC